MGVKPNQLSLFLIIYYNREKRDYNILKYSLLL
nr:MAG TPA: hypothetical protein [Caudoviricetes sp.]